MQFRKRWRPVEFEYGPKVPEPGALWTYGERVVIRIHEVREIDPVDWDDKDQAAYNRGVEIFRAFHASSFEPPARREWEDRPRVLVVRKVRLGREVGKIVHIKLRPYTFALSVVLPEHYAVCAVCQEPYPCGHREAQKVAAREMQTVETLMSRQPGCCWACGDPITTRIRKVITFDGANVDLPTAHSPSFHLGRAECREAAAAYEARWVAAEPGHRRPRLGAAAERSGGS